MPIEPSKRAPFQPKNSRSPPDSRAICRADRHRKSPHAKTRESLQLGARAPYRSFERVAVDELCFAAERRRSDDRTGASNSFARGGLHSQDRAAARVLLGARRSRGASTGALASRIARFSRSTETPPRRWRLGYRLNNSSSRSPGTVSDTSSSTSRPWLNS